MPVYNTLYKGSFVNIETDITNANNQKQIDVYIYDVASGTAVSPSLTVDLEMSEEPVIFETVNNTEDKFEVIRPKRAEIKIFSSTDIYVEIFARGGDRSWYVEIKYDSVLKFSGWLSISDLSQDFLPDPNIITLVATDGLNFLADEDLTDFDSSIPENEYEIMFFISRALSKCGINRDIWCIYNIREESSSTVNGDSAGDGHFFKNEYLLAGTFEKDINLMQDCKTVLTNIFKRSAYLTTYNGVVIIIRVDEINTNDYYIFKYDYTGTFLSKTTATFSKSVGASELIGWMGDDQVKIMDRAIKEIILKFSFNYPRDIPCNIDFSKGDFIADLADETNADGVTENVKSYSMGCWQFLSKQGGVANQIGFYDQSPIANSDAYIKKFYFNGDEKHRELVIETPTASGTGVPYVKSKAIPLSIGDKINLSVDLSYSNIGAHTGYVDTPVMVGLFADSGNIYWWVAYDIGSPTMKGFWQLTPPTGPGSVIPDFYTGAAVDDPPLNINFESPPLPESGDIYLYLINPYSDQIKAHYQSLSLDIISLINGSYKVFKSQQLKIIQQTDPDQYTGLIEDEVFITDAPRKTMKGAILRITGSTSLYTGSITFASPNSITTALGSGDKRALFPEGIKITTGSSLNFGIYTIESVVYHSVPNNTEILIKEDNISTITETTTISKINFGLAGRFYDGSLYPAGTTSVNYHKFAELQIWDNWNQFNRVMAKFEGNIDHLDSTNDIPDIVHKYLLTDSNLSTNNKTFMLLHYKSNLHDAETEVFLHEVFDSGVTKDFTDPELKYLT